MTRKVQKDFFYEMGVKFSEIFEDVSVEKATEKAASQNKPGENAKLKIIDQRFVKSNIKLVDKEQYDRPKENKKSWRKGAKDSS